MKKFLTYLTIIFFSLITLLHSNEYQIKLKKLEEYLNQGLINKTDYNDAKKALMKLEEISQKKQKAEKAPKEQNKKQKFVIKKFKDQPKGSREFEKMEMIFADYRIYTHRPGAVKVRSLSSNKQLAVISDNLNIKYYNNSREIINFENVSDTKSVLRIKNVPVLTWDKKEVTKHQARFYQVLGLGTKPFHYYINLYNSNKIIALNYSEFDKKIQKAIDKAKVRLASTYNVSIAQIDNLMKQRENKAFAELQKLIGEKKDLALEASIQSTIESELENQLNKALGASLASEFSTAIEEATGQAVDAAVENELASAIDEAIAEAISMGISEAAISAGIAAALAALAAGASEEEAIAAGEAACGC